MRVKGFGAQAERLEEGLAGEGGGGDGLARGAEKALFAARRVAGAHRSLARRREAASAKEPSATGRETREGEEERVSQLAREGGEGVKRIVVVAAHGRPSARS